MFEQMAESNMEMDESVNAMQLKLLDYFLLKTAMTHSNSILLSKGKKK